MNPSGIFYISGFDHSRSFVTGLQIQMPSEISRVTSILAVLTRIEITAIGKVCGEQECT